MNSKSKIVLLGLLAVFALGSLTSAAQAVEAKEGPWWTVSGSKLGKGETKAVTSSILPGTTFTLEVPGLITLTSNAVTNTGIIIGGDPGTDQTSVTFKNIVTKEFANCKVTNEKGPENTVKVTVPTELVWADEAGARSKTHALDFFEGTKEVKIEETTYKEVFVVLELSGVCPAGTSGEQPVTGNVVAEIKKVKTGECVAALAGEQSKEGCLVFPATLIKEFFKWNGTTEKYVLTKLEEKTAPTYLKFGKHEAKLSGSEVVEQEKNEFGVNG